jgi:hypothetical protein
MGAFFVSPLSPGSYLFFFLRLLKSHVRAGGNGLGITVHKWVILFVLLFPTLNHRSSYNHAQNQSRLPKSLDAWTTKKTTLVKLNAKKDHH